MAGLFTYLKAPSSREGLVTLDRRGAWVHITEWISTLSLWRRRTAPFRSPLHAQIWFEYRRWGRLLPALALGVTAFVILTAGAPLLTLPVDLLPMIVIVLCGAGQCAGLALVAIDHKDQTSGLAGFHMTRPVTTHVLVAARFRAAVRSVCVALAWSAVTVAVGAIVSRWWLKLAAVDHVPIMTVRLALDFVVIGIALWALLHVPVHVLVFQGTLLLSAICLGLVIELAPPVSYDQAENVLCVLLTLAIAAAAAVSFVKAKRRDLLRPRDMVVAAGLVVVSALGLGSSHLRLIFSPASGALEVILLAGLCIAATLPLAAVPLAIHRKRHQ